MENYGLMLDVSRGKAYTVSQIKKIMYYTKQFGYTYINLYIEDLIYLEEYPQFGYMRGRYSDDEIIELVKYGREIELDIYPAIQTLGHFEHFLKWNDSDVLADTKKVINVTKQETMDFLNALIQKCAKLFGGSKINIGMDEAFDLGMGSVFRETGTLDQKQLYLEHLTNLVRICKDSGYQTIKIWSDMLFSVYANKGEEELYSDIEGLEFQEIDQSLELVFWNYWSREKEQYVETIQAHKKFTNNVSVALGVHTWGEPTYLSKQLVITEQALLACEEEEITDILFTMWGDDGSLYNLDTAIYGMYLTSCLFLGAEPVKKQFELITNINYNSASSFSKISDIGLNPLMVLWNDPITNIFLNTLTQEEIVQVMKKCKMQMLEEVDRLTELNNLYLKIVYSELDLYLNDNIDDSLIDNYNVLLASLESLWLEEAKFQGIEELQKRINTKIYRLKYLIANFENEQINAIRNDRNYIGYEVKNSYEYISNPTNSRW